MSNQTTKRIDIISNLGKYFLDQQISGFDKEYIKGKSSEITLTNNETKDVVKAISTQENGKNLFKRSTTNVTGQKSGFLNFLRLFRTATSKR